MKDHTFGKSGYDKRSSLCGKDNPRKPKPAVGGAPKIKVSRNMDGVRGGKSSRNSSHHGY